MSLDAKNQKKTGEGKLVLAAVVGLLAVFALLIMFVSGGIVRQAQIFLPEKGADTVAIQKVDGKVAVVGITGIKGVNPTLTMRTGEYILEITVINQDSVPHSLFIDRANVSTGVLQPGDRTVIDLRSAAPAEFNYYEQGSSAPLGHIEAFKVGGYD